MPEELIQLVFGTPLSTDEARKRYYGMKMLAEIMEPNNTSKEINQEDLILLRDERNALNNERRINTRDKRFQDKLVEAVKEGMANYPFPPLPLSDAPMDLSDTEMVVQLSDWHYGIVVDNDYNKFNPAIAKERLDKFAAEIVAEYKRTKPKTIHFVFQGDLISGNIHNTLRLQNQEDLVEQITIVSLLVRNLLFTVARGTKCLFKVYFVAGNHDRVTPKKEDSLAGEDYVKLIKWIVESQLHHITNIKFKDYNPNQVFFNVCGLNFAAVHGDKDRFDTLLQKLMTMARKPLDCILTAHHHHTHFRDVQKCRLISNGSLVGMDDYAERLRLINHPCQNILSVTPDGNIRLYPVILKEGDGIG